MAKRKFKSHGKVAGPARTSTKEKAVKDNPFEIRINKRRYDILGRKTKHDKGKPGVSRSKGLKKREKTLLVEYKHRKKANTFIDKRFGEYDENLSLEEKMLKRFATEKQKHHEKAGLFNLEDEDLTHFGQSLGEIKQFDDPTLSDEESENEDYVNSNNFGGFLKRRAPNQQQNDNEPRSKKEIMEEVVANAKFKKHERQVLKEESETMRQKLDDDLDGVRGLLNFRADATGPEPKVKGDDYDKSVREMAFEMKAQASDKLKTEEQIARQEEEKLRKLEAERIRRMKGVSVEEKKPTHRSADDLDDGFILDMDKRSMLLYKDGKMVMPDDYDPDSEAEDVASGMNENEWEENEEDDDEKEQDEEDKSEEEFDSDLESSDNVSDDETKQESSSLVDKSNNDNPAVDKLSKKTKDSLPYTFNAPKNFEEFCKLIDNRSTKEQLTVIERIQKCNHPKLNPANKVKMECFFDILVQFVGELASKDSPELSIIDGLVSHLFNLAQHSPLHAAKSMQDILKRLQKQFCAMSKKKKTPTLEMVLYLRIMSLLFPTSDFRHGVCTPAFVFISQILSQMVVQTVEDVFKGLFICSLVYEFVHISKRYVPEVINYFIGILYLSSEKTEPLGKVFLPFKESSKHNDILNISSPQKISTSSDNFKRINIVKIFSTTERDDANDTTRVHVVRMCLTLLGKFISLYTGLMSFPEIFQPVVHHMQRIKISNYPPGIQSLISGTLKSITSHKIKRQHLTLQKQRPQPIQTFEPKFEERYEVKRKHSTGNKNINERQKLRYKHKKEFKGALREIRKDSQFLSRQQLQEQLERDAERSRKTKEIQALLSNQQAEANEFNRKKRKLKN